MFRNTGKEEKVTKKVVLVLVANVNILSEVPVRVYAVCT